MSLGLFQGGLSYLPSSVPALGQLSPSHWFLCDLQLPYSLVSNPLFFGGGEVVCFLFETGSHVAYAGLELPT